MSEIPDADRPHSRACGYLRHHHGPGCASDCPTCHGPLTEKTSPQPQPLDGLDPSDELLRDAQAHTRRAYRQGWAAGYSAGRLAAEPIVRQQVERERAELVRHYGTPQTPAQNRAGEREDITHG